MIEDLSKIDGVADYPRIGIFGLGIMGGAIAKNLVDDGYQVFGYDPDAVQCKNAENAGIKITGSVKEVAENSNIMFSSLPNADALDAIVSELITLSESDRSAGILMELSTLDLVTKQENTLKTLVQPCLVVSNEGDPINYITPRVKSLRPDFSFFELKGGSVFIIHDEPRRWVNAFIDFVKPD